MNRAKNKTGYREPVKLRSKKLADGSESLYLDIYMKGIRRYEFLKLYLQPEIDKKIKTLNKNTIIVAETLKAQRIVELNKGKIELLKKTKEQKISLEEWLETYRSLQERKGIKNPEKMNSVFKVILEYCKIRHQGAPWINLIDKEWVTGFITWLQSGYLKKNGKKLGKGTIVYYSSQLSAILNTAVQKGLINENPFSRLPSSEKIRKPDSLRQFLTVDELKRLSETSCRNSIVKDAFMFSCYCGLRISDVRRLSFENINGSNGQYRLAINMKKTGKRVYIPLSNNALRWLPRSREEANRLVFDSLPCLTTINHIIKKWSHDAGIKKHVTFHTSRHTFGTLMITAGADLYVTSKLMGHSDVRTTQIYARIIDAKKIEAVNMLDRMFEK